MKDQLSKLEEAEKQVLKAGRALTHEETRSLVIASHYLLTKAITILKKQTEAGE